MIQLADVYLFVVAGRYSQRKGFMADELKKALKDKDLHANNYKDWPR
jgi:hypothetical protein